MLKPDVAEWLDLPWSRSMIYEIDDDGNEFYVARHPELPGCMAQGSTPEEAIASLREAREMYLQVLVKHGVPVPEPRVLCRENTFRWVDA